MPERHELLLAVAPAVLAWASMAVGGPVASLQAALIDQGLDVVPAAVVAAASAVLMFHVLYAAVAAAGDAVARRGLAKADSLPAEFSREFGPEGDTTGC